MPLYAGIRLGIHCKPKYMFTGIQNYINGENMYEYFPVKVDRKLKYELSYLFRKYRAIDEFM